MSSKSLLSDRHWHTIERHLPEKRRDWHLVEAILYRQFSGQGLTEVAELFQVTRTRLHQWTVQFEADGTLPAIMAALKLEPAGAAARSRGGSRPTYWRNESMMAAVAQIRLEGFREALRAGRR